jgi:hypothetical protein
MRQQLLSKGYNALDILGTFFKVLKYSDTNEFLKVEFIKVCTRPTHSIW